MCEYLSTEDNKTCVAALSDSYGKQCPYLGEHVYGIPCYVKESMETAMERNSCP